MRLVCKNCEYKLPTENYYYSGWQHCPVCAAKADIPPEPKGLLVCPDCGTDHSLVVECYSEEGGRYCSQCGHRFDEEVILRLKGAQSQEAIPGPAAE